MNFMLKIIHKTGS